MTRPLEVAPSELTLTDPEEAAQRIGLGRVDMEIRWMASLDDGDTLRLWRSWTGHEIYRATFERRAGILTQSGLHVESAPEAHRVNAKDRHAEQFVETLRHCLALITPARA